MELKAPVIGILRGVEAGFFNELMQTCFAAGLRALEVTFNTPGAERIISGARGVVPSGKLLGMGTVRNQEEARRAVGAGAMFLVTPNLDRQVIEYARRMEIPVVAGALTPTEVYGARAAGADLIKVFPCAAVGGPSYIKELRGPFDDIPLVAVGGVNINNIEQYFAAGSKAVGMGSSLFGPQAMRDRDLGLIAANVKKIIARCPEPLDKVLL